MRIIEIGDRVSAAYCGELRALGLEVSARTVRRYRRQALRPPPSQSWRTFLRNHVPQIWAVDLFTVQTATLRTLYVIVFIGHGRRRIVHLNVTRHPTASWIWRQLLQATRWGALPAAFGAGGGVARLTRHTAGPSGALTALGSVGAPQPTPCARVDG